MLGLTADAFVLVGLGIECAKWFRANNITVVSSRSGTIFTESFFHGLPANDFPTILVLHKWIAKRWLFIWTSKVLLLGQESAV